MPGTRLLTEGGRSECLERVIRVRELLLTEGGRSECLERVIRVSLFVYAHHIYWKIALNSDGVVHQPSSQGSQGRGDCKLL